MTSDEPHDDDRMATPEDLLIIPSKRPRRGLGYIPDSRDDRDRKARTIFGARRGLPVEAMDLERCVPGVVDQGMTSSCVGQAIGGAIDTRIRRLGRWDAPLVSRQAIYTFARSLDRESKTERLVDSGTSPRAAMKGLRTWGVPTAARWPFDPATINDPLPWDVMQQASTFAISAWYRIDSSGKERVEDMCQAFAVGYPVAFGVTVDEAFMDAGKAPIESLDPTKAVGGHMMYALGYKTSGGERLIRCVNSWGVGWGDSGLFWAREAFFRAASDCYVIQVG